MIRKFCAAAIFWNIFADLRILPEFDLTFSLGLRFSMRSPSGSTLARIRFALLRRRSRPIASASLRRPRGSIWAIKPPTQSSSASS